MKNFKIMLETFISDAEKNIDKKENKIDKETIKKIFENHKFEGINSLSALLEKMIEDIKNKKELNSFYNMFDSFLKISKNELPLSEINPSNVEKMIYIYELEFIDMLVSVLKDLTENFYEKN